MLKSPVLTRIYHFLKGPNPLHPAVWKGRLPSISFRRFKTADAPGCIELYALNEKGRFPQDYIERYRQSLDTQKSYYLVGELDGRIVAAGAVSYWMRQDLVVLAFGLVHPDYQRRGIGTAERFLMGGGAVQLWGQLDQLQQSAVGEAVHSEEGQLPV